MFVRVVACSEDQEGFDGEPGVEVLYEQRLLQAKNGRTLPTDIGSPGGAYIIEAFRICALGNRALAAGLTADIPEGVILDREKDLGIRDDDGEPVR
jgi:hypothetical protein